jgi:hypothetical protein
MNAAVEYLRRAIEDSRVVELRHDRDGRWESGLYEDLGELVAEIRRRQDTGNLYTTLNLPTAPASNSMCGPALKDGDIETITRIVFDVDPARPAGQPATDVECAAAAAGRDLLVRALTAHGWPVPALGMSGNGAHAVFRARLRANDAWRQCSAVLYAALRKHLHTQFAELRVSLDTHGRSYGLPR